MALGNKPVFAQKPLTATCTVTAAVTNLTTNTPGNTVLLCTGGLDGMLIGKIGAIPRGAAVTAGALYLFLRKAADAANVRRLLPYSALMPAYAYATTTEMKPTVFADIAESNPLRIEAGDEVYVGEAVANNIEVSAFPVSYTAPV